MLCPNTEALEVMDLPEDLKSEPAPPPKRKLVHLGSPKVAVPLKKEVPLGNWGKFQFSASSRSQ